MLRERWFSFTDGEREAGLSYARLYRLCHDGRRSLAGNIVKLEFFKSELGLATSHEALDRFRSRLSDFEE